MLSDREAFEKEWKHVSLVFYFNLNLQYAIQKSKMMGDYQEPVNPHLEKLHRDAKEIREK